MEIIQLTILPVLLLVILFMSGLGFSSYVFKDLDKEAQFILSPIIGIASIVFMMSLLLLIGLTGTQASLITAFCLLTIDIARTKYIFGFLKFIRLRLLFFCLILLIFLYYILTPLYKLGYATTITYFVADSAIYIPATDFITNNSIYSKTINIHKNPLSDSKFNTLEQHYAWTFFRGGARWGTPIVLGFFHILSGYSSVQIFSILSYLFYIISGLLIYKIIDSYVIKTNMFISILLSLFYLFNYLLFWIVINGQIAQTVVATFFLSIIYLINNDNLFNKKIPKELWIGFFLISNAVLLIYSEYMPFIFIPFLSYCFYKFVKNKEIKNGVIFIFLVLFINPISIFLALKSILQFSNNITLYGISMPNFNFFEIMGFSNVIIKSRMIYSVQEKIFEILIYISVFGTLIYLLIKKFDYFVFSILYLILFLIIKYKLYSSYTNFKFITYTLPFILMSYLFFIKFIYIKYKKTRILLFIFLTFCIFIQFEQLNMFITQLRELKYIVSKKYQSIDSLINNNKVKKITYLNNSDIWSMSWIKYYLKNNEIYFTNEKVVRIQPYFLVNNFKNYSTDFIISDNALLSSNQYYKLYKPDYLVLFDYLTWHPTEHNQQNVPWRWMNQDGLVYINVGTPGIYKLSFNILSFLKDRHIDIKLNNIILNKNLIVTQVGNVQNLLLNLSKGTNKLTFHSLEEPNKPPLSLDQRKLSIQISYIEFKKVLDETLY